MPQITIQQNHNLAGQQYLEKRVIEAKHEHTIRLKPADLPAAQSGTLSTRTDDDTGELTLGAGHGITDGDRVDVYWAGGARRGMTVGTVDGDDVPIDGGAGNNLPVQDTAMTVMVAVQQALIVSGDDVQALVVSATKEATIVLEDSGGEELHIHLEAGGVYDWHTLKGTTNPIAGDSIEAIFVTHGDSTGAAEVKLGVLHN